MPTLLIATHNSWKAKLFGSLAKDEGFEVLSLRDIDTPLPPPIESGTTVTENALIKARHYHSDAFPWVFGDDTGLEIDALNGEPGVQLRRWGGRFPDDVDDETWLAYLLKRLDGVPPEARGASFVDGWAIVAPDKQEYTHVTRAAFQIATHPVNQPVPGSPVMSVALGLSNDPVSILTEAKSRWQGWGILKKLQEKPN